MSSCRAVCIGLCILSGACSKPIPDLGSLNGCYFGPGPGPLFEIRNAKLISPQVTSTIALASVTSESSEISFSPGIRLTFNARKAAMVAPGEDNYALTYQRGAHRYILLSTGVSPLELVQKDCAGAVPVG